MRALTLLLPANLVFLSLAWATSFAAIGGLVTPDSMWVVSRAPEGNAVFNQSLQRTAPNAGGSCFAALAEGSGFRVLRLGSKLLPDSRWPADGVTISFASGRGDALALVADDDNAILALWTEAQDSASCGLFAQRLLADGTRDPAWPTGGMPIRGRDVSRGEAASGRFATGSLAAIGDSAGGVFVAWRDTRHDAGDVYIQHVLSNGALPSGWTPEGARATVAPGVQSHAALLADGDEGVFVAWQDERATASPRVYVQHLGAEGEPLAGWPAEGVPADPAAPGEQSEPGLSGDGLGGAILTWNDTRDSARKLMAAHFAGQVDLPPGISLVSADAGPRGVRIRWEGRAARDLELVVERSEEGDPWREIARVHGDLQGLVVFDDSAVREGRHYAYRVSRETGDGLVISGTTDVDVARQPRFTLEPIAADTSVDRIEVSFGLPNRSPATLELLDGGGRVVESLDLSALDAGNHVLEMIAARTLPPGLYTMRLEQSGHLALRRTHLRHTPVRVRRTRRG